MVPNYAHGGHSCQRAQIHLPVKSVADDPGHCLRRNRGRRGNQAADIRRTKRRRRVNLADRGDAEIDEAELLSALRSGQPIDGGRAIDGGEAGAKRTVQAVLLRRCCHELKDQVDPRGLRLGNALIAGRLDLAGLTVPFPLRFDGCEFDSAPVVEGAELFELALTGCSRLPGLLGNGLRLRRDLDLSGSRVAGAHRTSASMSSTRRRSGCASRRSAAACSASAPGSTARAGARSRPTGSASAAPSG